MVPQQVLNTSQIKQAIDSKSGYPFELDIARRIETDNDYTYLVESNYSFEDQDSGEARELDFHAIQAIPISTRRSEYILLVILGSCKNITIKLATLTSAPTYNVRAITPKRNCRNFKTLVFLSLFFLIITAGNFTRTNTIAIKKAIIAILT